MAKYNKTRPEKRENESVQGSKIMFTKKTHLYPLIINYIYLHLMLQLLNNVNWSGSDVAGHANPL